MKWNKFTITLLLISISGLNLAAQEIINPNYGLKFPETIEIIRVRITESATIVDMSIQNQVRNGYFCIDENTYIESENRRVKLKELTGLPLCPETYEFRSVGEKVYFSLEFDALPSGNSWFDIIEYCGQDCFSILAVNIDESVNRKINLAFNAMDRLDPEEAIDIFSEILPSLKASGHGLTGSIYLNLVELLAANNMDENLQELLSDFRSSPMPHKDNYQTILDNMGY